MNDVIYSRMCLTFIFINPDPKGKFRLIILNNRDEFIDRPTEELQWRNGVLGGVDLLDPARGTWLGVDSRGRVGNLVSITQPAATKNKDAPSRGAIPCDYLRSPSTAEYFCDSLLSTANQYNGFQFLALEKNPSSTFDLYSVTNLYVDKVETVKWAAGVHVIGNSPPHVPFKKTMYGKERMESLVKGLSDESTENDVIEALMRIATDSKCHSPDPQLASQTARTDAYNRPLSSIFVRFPPNTVRYGTRSHSVFIVDSEDRATFYEKRICSVGDDVMTAKWSEKTVTFTLNSEK